MALMPERMMPLALAHEDGTLYASPVFSISNPTRDRTERFEIKLPDALAPGPAYDSARASQQLQLYSSGLPDPRIRSDMKVGIEVNPDLPDRYAEALDGMKTKKWGGLLVENIVQARGRFEDDPEAVADVGDHIDGEPWTVGGELSATFEAKWLDDWLDEFREEPADRPWQSHGAVTGRWSSSCLDGEPHAAPALSEDRQWDPVSLIEETLVETEPKPETEPEPEPVEVAVARAVAVMMS